MVRCPGNLFSLHYRGISTTVSRTNKESISLPIASFTASWEGRVLRMHLEVEPVGQGKDAPGTHETCWHLAGAETFDLLCLRGSLPWPPSLVQGQSHVLSQLHQCHRHTVMWLPFHCVLFTTPWHMAGTYLIPSNWWNGQNACVLRQEGRTGARLWGVWNYPASACHITWASPASLSIK